MHEQQKMNPRIPPQGIPRRVVARHHAPEHLEEKRRSDRRTAIERDGAAALQHESTIG